MKYMKRRQTLQGADGEGLDPAIFIDVCGV